MDVGILVRNPLALQGRPGTRPPVGYSIGLLPHLSGMIGLGLTSCPDSLARLGLPVSFVEGFQNSLRFASLEKFLTAMTNTWLREQSNSLVTSSISLKISSGTDIAVFIP
jgi:hypothetical protein